MIISNPFIYTFKTPIGNYLYDVNRNSILRINSKVYDVLKDIKELNLDSITNDCEVRDTIKRMVEEGFLSSKRVKNIEHPGSEVLEYSYDSKLHTVTLQLTQQCNLRCAYCVYSGNYLNRGHSNKVMTFETAKKGIDFLISHSSDSRNLNIGFYGGEPLLEFDMIKKCIEYAEKEAEGKNVSFNITTNGTLIKTEIINYFQEHHVDLTISLDGAKQNHDKNRKFSGSGCGSFDVIIKNLEDIKEKFPEYFNKIYFNVVIDPENDFKCTNDFFATYDVIKDSPINSSIINDSYSKKEVKGNDDFSVKWGYEIFKLFLSKFGELDEKHISKLVARYFDRIKVEMNDKRNPVDSMPEKNHPGGPCLPGIQRLFINVNGDFYPCERVSEESDVMKIGNVDKGFFIDNARRILNVGKLTEESCKNCWAFRFCGLCAAQADTLSDLSGEKKSTGCERARRSAEELFRNYCMLKEFGYDFENKNELMFYNF